MANRYGGIIAALERLYLEPEFGKKLAITGAAVIKERYSIQSSINLFQSIMRGEVHSWKYVTKDLNRKVVLYDAKTDYSTEEIVILSTIVSSNEFAKLKKYINTVDKEAFINATKVHQPFKCISEVINK